MPVTAVVAVVALLAAIVIMTLALTGMDPVSPARERQGIVRWLRVHPRVGRAAQTIDERVIGGLALVLALGIMFAGALVVGVLLDMVDQNRGIARWDRAVAEWGSANASSSTTDALRWITDLGATAVLAVVLSTVAIVDYRRHHNRHVPLFLAVTLGGVVLVNRLLKELVDRDRPDVDRLVPASGPSFPSGHSAAATAGWLAAMFVLSRHATRRRRAVLAGAATLVSVLVAASRALLGVHWLTDVLAGMTVGWAWFLLAALAFGGRVQHLGEPVAAAAEPSSAGRAPALR